MHTNLKPAFCTIAAVTIASKCNAARKSRLRAAESAITDSRAERIILTAKEPAWPGMTPISIAVCNGDLEVTRLLLDRNADPNQEAVIEAPLFTAAYQPRKTILIMKLLLQHKANPNQKGCFGLVPLSAAICVDDKVDNKEVALLLLQHGAVIKKIDRTLCTTQGGHSDMCVVCAYPQAMTNLSNWCNSSVSKLDDEINSAASWYSDLIMNELPNERAILTELAGLIGQYVGIPKDEEEKINFLLRSGYIKF